MAFLDFLFSPIIGYSPAIVLILLSFLISLLITLIYKWMTDQTVMKSLKEDIKKSQQQMRQSKDNPKKVLELQKVAMEKNMQYMMKSMKPTLVTFIPLILVFGWLSEHYSYRPILPEHEFNITAYFMEGVAGKAKILPAEGLEIVVDGEQQILDGKASWKLKGKEGNYLIEVEYDGRKYDKEIVISSKYESATPAKFFKEEKIKSINVDVKKLRIFGENFKIINYHPGWLGVYIITSIIFSMGLRKLMNLY